MTEQPKTPWDAGAPPLNQIPAVGESRAVPDVSVEDSCLFDGDQAADEQLHEVEPPRARSLPWAGHGGREAYLAALAGWKPYRATTGTAA